MANNKITQEELVKYIMFIMQGDSYLQSQAKGDVAKLKILEKEIEKIGTKSVSLANVGALLNITINEVIIPQLQQYSKELLLVERVIKGDAVAVDKLDSFVEELHKNGDLSEKSYDYCKSNKINVSENAFNCVAKEIAQEVNQNQDNLAKTKETDDKEVAGKSKNSHKTPIAKASYKNNKEDRNIINLKSHKKQLIINSSKVK